MRGDPEGFEFLEQFYHDEVDLAHHINVFEAEMLINHYRERWIKKNEIPTERAEESEN